MSLITGILMMGGIIYAIQIFTRSDFGPVSTDARIVRVLIAAALIVGAALVAARFVGIYGDGSECGAGPWSWDC